MASKRIVVPVMCHGDGAIEAFEYVAAVKAIEKGMESSSVQKKERLFFIVKRTTDCFYKGSGENGRVFP